MDRRLLLWFASAGLTLLTLPLAGAEPQVLDERFQLKLVAAEPDLVTPIGLAFDAQGRLLVIESHTHFPPKGYAGPKTDRIRLIEDTDGDGQADRFRTFYEDEKLIAAMSLRTHPDGWVYVATRDRVFRIRDTDGDDVADEVLELARLETPGKYPHNGLGGLAFDRQGRLYFGLGENLGADYQLIGADGKTYQGGGEGGNIYRIERDGSELTRIATGFWNPFGICVDPAGRVFAVGNDPDSQPPCRLVHVVPTGDFGYQFRYGRTGRHPLQAWNGELPGTLPMVAGTGEAPSSVLPYDGALWSGSWGDHRVERFPLRPRGASVASVAETVVQGDENFRPIDFAAAPDGSLYFTDWVDKSYPVHGKGRLWRLSRKDSTGVPTKKWLELSADEKTADRLREKPDLAAAATDDPFLRQAIVAGLVKQQPKKDDRSWQELSDPRQRLVALQAIRWAAEEQRTTPQEFTKLLQIALRDPSPQVRLFAVRWVADQRIVALRTDLEKVLGSGVITPRLFQATLAALDWLEEKKVGLPRNVDYFHYAATVLADASRPAALRVLALRLLPPEHPAASVEQLQALSQSGDAQLQREAIRRLALSSDPLRAAPLQALANDAAISDQRRADAVFGISRLEAAIAQPLLEKLAGQESAAGKEAAIALRLLAGKKPPQQAKPAAVEIDRWVAALGESGDPEAGWRIFHDSRRGNCSSCHRLQGLGADVGPDLTEVGKRLPPKRLVVSILQPSQEMAPMFTPSILQTDDGQVLTGLSQGLTADGASERFVGVDGKSFTVPLAQIENRRHSPKSLMPDGLDQALSIEELQNLLKLLAGPQAD